MTLDKKPTSVSEMKIWNYDGSSTGQAPGDDSEVLMRPVRIFPDPFRGGDNILVLCETLLPGSLAPIPTNTRCAAKATFDKNLGLKPWFGIEQEYTLLKQDGIRPFGFPETGFPAAQGPYYCGAGFDSALGRPIADAHYKACLYAGCHTNYSTEKMRNDGGYAEIIKAIEKLGKKHDEHIKIYGEGNERRLTGAHETAPITKFSYGVANRGASIRIPRDAEKEGKGYFEDRRPASNMDPYVVTAKIFDTTCL